MTDKIYYYCRFCAERLAARLVMDFDSHPKLREDVQKKLSVFQSNFIDLDLQILPQSICKSCYETLNRAFLFANNVRKSQIVLIELYLDIVGSDDDNEESLSKMRPSVEDSLCVNGEDTTIHEEQNTSISIDKEYFLINKNKCVGAEAIKDLSDEGATSSGRHETGKEPNVDRELVNLNSTAVDNDTSLSQNHESITIIECKEESSDNEEDTGRTVNTDSTEDRGIVMETELSQNQDSHECKEENTENYEETDRTVNIDSIEDNGDILKETASPQNQESLDCKEETSDNDYEDKELVDPLDTTTEDDPIIGETLSLQGQDTYDSQGEVTSSRHDTICKEPNEDSELLNLNTTATGKDTMTPQNHEIITVIEFIEETTDNEEDSDKIDTKYSTEDRGATAKKTPSSESRESKSSKEVTKANDNDTDRIVSTNSTVDRSLVVKETVATQSQESFECKEQKKKKRMKENNDKYYDEKQQKKKRKRENNYNDYEKKKEIDSTTDSDPILKERVPLDSRETSECQETLTVKDKDPRVDKVSVSVVTWNTNLYECKLCDSKFSDINSLREHCKSLHQVCNGFRCRECSMELADFYMFVSHHREHRPELEGFCQFCNMELKFAGAGHVASHGDLFCKFCGEVFTSASGFKEHYLLYAPEAENNGRSHCVHCGHDLGNDETPHRDSLSDACVACGEHFREQTLQQQLSIQQDNPIFLTKASIKEKSCKNYNKKQSSHKQFKFESELQRHMARHYDVHPFYCKLCDAKFKRRSHFNRHLKSSKHARAAAGETCSVKFKYFECDHCQKRFKHKPRLKDHLSLHYDVFHFKCGHCDKKFKLRNTYKRHLRENHNPPSQQYNSKTYLRSHMVCHNDVYPFYCKLCDAKFKRHRQLNSHLKSSKHARVAAGETSSVKCEYYECDHCQKRFKHKSRLKDHLSHHYDVFHFKCGHCDKKFKLRDTYNRHLRENHNPSATQFECHLCHKQCKAKSYLKEHMVSHYDVYPFYCKFCDTKYKWRRNWNIHLKSNKHARAAGIQKYFECNHCHKRFKKNSLLKNHLVVHYDMFPFKCSHCDKKFNLRKTYRLHLSMSHNPSATQFECDHCHKRFPCKSRIQKHMDIHYDVYPFHCKLCDAKFKRKFYLIQHLKSSKHAKAAGAAL